MGEKTLNKNFYEEITVEPAKDRRPRPRRFPQREVVKLEELSGMMTIAQVALKLGVHYQTVWRMIKRGDLECQPVATSIYVSVKQLEDYLSNARYKHAKKLQGL